MSLAGIPVACYYHGVKARITILLALLLSTVCARVSPAESWEDALRGGLLGAAVGVIVGHNSSDLDTTVAVPAFAAAGALIGYAYNRDGVYYDNTDYWGYDYPYTRAYRHGYGYDNWGRSYWNSPHYGYRPRARRYIPYRVVRNVGPLRETVVVPRQKPPQPEPVNRHPGVDLITVPLTASNGLVIDVHVLVVNGRFIGPQGEHYDEKPTAETLAARYLPPPRE